MTNKGTYERKMLRKGKQKRRREKERGEGGLSI